MPLLASHYSWVTLAEQFSGLDGVLESGAIRSLRRERNDLGATLRMSQIFPSSLSN
jgi:hypothetical protein